MPFMARTSPQSPAAVATPTAPATPAVTRMRKAVKTVATTATWITKKEAHSHAAGEERGEMNRPSTEAAPATGKVHVHADGTPHVQAAQAPAQPAATAADPHAGMTMPQARPTEPAPLATTISTDFTHRSPSMTRTLTTLSLTLLLAMPGLSQAHDGTHATTAANAIPAAAQPAVASVEQFSAALQAGDLERAGSFLAEDVLILESGGTERSREEYLGGHARHDAAFLKTAHVQLLRRTARVEGDLAWVGSESEVHATREGKPMTLLSTETMVLKRTAQGWRIVHIHWSSRPKR